MKGESTLMENNVCCKCGKEHENALSEVKIQLPPEGVLYNLADLFKVLGDYTRVRIISVLFIGEISVCELAELLNMSQSAISHQLRVLKDARLVKYRREGKSIFYSLDDGHIQNIFNQGMEHIIE